MVDAKVLEQNFEEYLEIAEYSFAKKKFNAAVTLYYKALTELCDLELLRKTNKIGANHTERFDLLKQASPKLFQIASRLFRFYRDSYNKELNETIALLVKNEVENAKRIVINTK